MVTIGDLENNEIESIHIEGITNIPLIKGEQGEKGDKGDKGETNNIKIGTVETGEKASATLEGESPNQILNLVLPKGDKGEQGEPGIKPVKGIDYFTEEEIQEIKSNILDQVNQFSVLVVEELPNDNIDEHTIYFVPKTKTEQNDVYDEFIYINNGWEHIGTTEVDLSSYYKKDEIDAKLEAVEGNEVYIGNPAEAPNSAKIIVEEDDFVEGSTLGKAEVYVGAEEPTTGEKVWFRKVKNHFNGELKAGTFLNGVPNTEMSTTRIRNTEYIGVKNNTDYTISAKYSKTLQINVMIYDEDKKFIKEVGWNNVPYTFTTTDTTKYIMFALRESSNANITTKDITEIQLEQGSKATTYEAYIEQKIYVRNSNGVYEEFAKKSEEVYSTEEQVIGTWIDGKPLYRIIKEYNVSAKETQSNDISSIPYDTIFINFGKSFNRWVANSSSSIIWNTSDNDKGNVWINYEKKLNILNSSNAARHYWITLEYTKTTD